MVPCISVSEQLVLTRTALRPVLIIMNNLSGFTDYLSSLVCIGGTTNTVLFEDVIAMVHRNNSEGSCREEQTRRRISTDIYIYIF